MKRRAPAYFLLAMCTALSRSAVADNATDTAAARAYGQDGVMLADQGKCAQAIEKLDRAEKLHHAPTTAVRLAECEITVGKIVAGTERLQRMLREGLPPGSPKIFVAAMDRAQKALDVALPRIATLRISVTAPAGTKPNVTIDEEAISGALIGADIPTDPGLHKVTASAVGFLPFSKDVTLKEGESNGITLVLVADPKYKPEPPADTNARAPATAQPPEAKPSRVLPFVAFGIGAVGIGVGTVAGLVVGGKSSDLSSNCRGDGSCPRSQESTLSSAETMAAVSTVGFIVGAAGVAAGVILLLTGPSGKASAQRTVRPLLGAGFAGLDGTF